jgi:hypothetical protein
MVAGRRFRCPVSRFLFSVAVTSGNALSLLVLLVAVAMRRAGARSDLESIVRICYDSSRFGSQENEKKQTIAKHLGWMNICRGLIIHESRKFASILEAGDSYAWRACLIREWVPPLLASQLFALPHFGTTTTPNLLLISGESQKFRSPLPTTQQRRPCSHTKVHIRTKELVAMGFTDLLTDAGLTGKLPFSCRASNTRSEV